MRSCYFKLFSCLVSLSHCKLYFLDSTRFRWVVQNLVLLGFRWVVRNPSTCFVWILLIGSESFILRIQLSGSESYPVRIPLSCLESLFAFGSDDVQNLVGFRWVVRIWSLVFIGLLIPSNWSWLWNLMRCKLRPNCVPLSLIFNAFMKHRFW